MDAQKLPRPLRRFADKIEDVSDERRGFEANGYWVYFTPGWILLPDGTHQMHEDTPTICAGYFRRVHPCDCAGCRKEAH